MVQPGMGALLCPGTASGCCRSGACGARPAVGKAKTQLSRLDVLCPLGVNAVCDPGQVWLWALCALNETFLH